MRAHLDIALPIYSLSAKEALTTLESIKNFTEISYRLIIVNDCAGSEITDMIREFSENLPSVVLLRNNRRQYFAKCINQCVEYAKSDYFVALHPQTVITDKFWVSKMTMPFKDSQAFMAGTDPLKEWNSLAPYALSKKDPPLHRCMTIFRKPTGKLMDEDLPHEPIKKTQDRILSQSMRVYMVPSLRVRVRMFDSEQKARAISGVTSDAEVLIDR